jgi:hypothetical protein
VRELLEQIYCDNCPPTLHCGENLTACDYNKKTIDAILATLKEQRYGTFHAYEDGIKCPKCGESGYFEPIK